MALLLADTDLDSPIGSFFKILSEDESGSCPVCCIALPNSPSPSANLVLPFCNQACREVAVCMCIMLDGCLQSRAHEVILLRLRDTLAQKALNIMQKIADKSVQHQRPLRSLLIQLAKQSDKIPASLFLQGVRLHQSGRGEIYVGGFANVHRGRYNHQDVALKVLRVFANSDEATRNDLKQKLHYEALIWRNVCHRHVLTFLGIDDHIFRGPCMVSAWMPHGQIRNKAQSLIRKHRRDDLYFLRYTYKWLCEILQGLDYLHGEGLVHGDLRGPNILIDDTRCVRLTDFGLAVFSEADSKEHGSSRGGHERWMAPEQISPETFQGVSERPTIFSDIFSFGCVCVELYTAHAPYFGLNDAQVMNSVPYGRRPSRTSVIDGIEVTLPIELWWIAEKCWAHDPLGRSTIQELLQEMAHLQIPWVSTLGGPVVISRTFTQLTSCQN